MTTPADSSAPALPEGLTDHLSTMSRTLGFFASVIKSGEPFTASCQAEYDAALAARVAIDDMLATPPPSDQLALLRRHVEGDCGRNAGLEVRTNAPLYVALSDVESFVIARSPAPSPETPVDA